MLEEQRELLDELGGTYHEVVGGDIGAALLDAARSLNATQIVMGASRRSRWQRLTRGSVIGRVIRESGPGIDVHVVSHPGGRSEDAFVVPRTQRPATLPRERVLLGFALTAVSLPLLTWVLSNLRSEFGLPTVMLLFLLLVVLVSGVGGLWPALAAAIGGSLLVNWYFVPPLYTFTIDEGENILAIVVFLVVAVVVSGFVSLASRRAVESQRTRAEAEALLRLAGSSPASAVLDSLCRVLGLDGAAVLHRQDDGWLVEAASGDRVPESPEAGSLTVDLDDEHVLALAGAPIRSEDQRVLDAFAKELAASVELGELEAEAETAGTLAAANELRAALLSAVSHDLRTPIAAVKASVTSLLQDDVDWTPEAQHEFLRTIDEETDRLNALVGNLLDMSRLQTGALEISSTPVGLEEVLPAAVRSIAAADGAIELDVSESLPARLRRSRPARARARQRPRERDPLLAARAAGARDRRRRRRRRRRARRGSRTGCPGCRARPPLRPVPAARRLVAGRRRRPRPRRREGLRRGDGRGDRGRGHAGRRAHDRASAAGRVMSRILVVDDEPQLLRALGTNLKARGYDVDLAPTGEAALTLAARKHPDLVILDLGLPGIDGVEVIRGLRGWTRVPVIVLSVRETERAKVEALDAGADDYVTKPFGMDELLARLRAALRRAAPGEEEAVVDTADFSVDLAAKRVTRNGSEVRLTPTEWHIVEVLVRNPGKLVTQRQLLQEVWGPQYERETNYLRVYLAQIRKKLEPDPAHPRYFLTEARMGYRFVLP